MILRNKSLHPICKALRRKGHRNFYVDSPIARTGKYRIEEDYWYVIIMDNPKDEKIIYLGRDKWEAIEAVQSMRYIYHESYPTEYADTRLYKPHSMHPLCNKMNTNGFKDYEIHGRFFLHYKGNIYKMGDTFKEAMQFISDNLHLQEI